MKRSLIAALAAVSLLAAGCAQLTPALPDTAAPADTESRGIAGTDWQSGSLSGIVPAAQLKALTGAYSGPAIWKSNNPEVIKGNGWLSLNSRTDATRGGAAYPLAGTSAIYLFHINKSGSAKFLHLIISNPQGTAVTISGKGSMYTNTQKPMTGAGAGQSYAVAADWLLNTPNTSFSNVSLASKKTYQVYQIALANNAMVDGRFEVTASAGVYVYTVVTSSGALPDAINATQGGPAAGDIYSPSDTKFGREAGVYANSVWSGTTEITLPSSTASPRYLGLCLNTTSKLPVAGVYLQDQNAPALMRLSDSADKTYGNYGHKFDVTLKLTNPLSVPQKVRLSFASNVTGTTDVPSFTFNGLALLNGAQKTIFTKPTQPKQVLATWTVPANAFFNGRLQFYVPGLITSGHQLILESGIQ